MKGKRSMGRVLIIVTGLLILSAVAGISCQPAATPTPTAQPSPTATASPTATSTPTAKPSPTPTPSPTTAQPIVLKYSEWSAKTATFEVACSWYIDEVEKRAGGRVKFDRYYSESLSKAVDQLDALKSGIVDIGPVNPNYYPGKLPLMTVGLLPPYPIDIWPAYMAYYKLYNDVPEVQKEVAGWNSRLLSVVGTSGYQVTSKRTLTQISDLKGQKLRALGNQATLAQEFGVVPVGISPTEMFDAIQKGTCDGSVGGPVVIVTYTLHEVCKYYYGLPFGGMTFFMGINNDSFNKLPADIQKIMTDPKLVEEAITNFHRIYQVEGDGAALNKMIAAGVKITQPTDDDVNKVIQAAKDKIYSKWISDMNSKGFAGQKVMDAFLKYVGDYTPLNPFKK